MGGLNLKHLSSQASMAEGFQHWEKVASAIEEKLMPPPKMPQPSEEQRKQVVSWIRTNLIAAALKNAGDPGRVTVRRLTSGEYAYTVRDLTGIEVKTDFAGDSVGGEGFTNFGDVQFMQDANLERYLESAKRVASHAVIGSGPLQFFADPGKSGLELSAISRIQAIYHANGFRSASGEGGMAYSLDRYGKAIFAAWRYDNRIRRGEPKLTIAQAAQKEGVSTRFVAHLLKVFQETNASYPTLEAVNLWKKMPLEEAQARTAAKSLQDFIVNWPRILFGAGAPAEGGRGDERNFVLSNESLKATTEHKFRRYQARPDETDKKVAKLYLSAANMNPSAKDQPYVIWRNASIRKVGANRALGETQTLRSALSQETIARLKFGKLPDGTSIDPNDFALAAGEKATVDIPIVEGSGGATVLFEVALGPSPNGDAVVRAMISNSDQPFTGVPQSVLLAQPKSPAFAAWKSNVLAFNSKLPAGSHGEPTPSDKDPIPPIFDNTIDMPERNAYHVKVKYYRDDRFITENILDDKTRTELEQAWTDLLSSFGYHDALLQLYSDKHKLNIKTSIGKLTPAEIEALPAEQRQVIKTWRTEYDGLEKSIAAAQPGHVDDAIRFAAKAWRRDLTSIEKDRLRGFYVNAREIQKQDHESALRTMLARVLVSPSFIYRLENQPQMTAAKALAGQELASRLSYFLWSSVPDAELTRAANSGELANPAQLDKQVRRMIADPKARRFATEFFGQWLGFYRFDQYSGIDTGRYPEFNDDLKSAMYDEAVSFFEHIVRQDRPVREMFSSDYTFLNQTLAKHYGVTKEINSKLATEKVEGTRQFGRGGMLSLGAVLTVTSAPLRTSPVKRGDWVLRRILGTPTPPPPANAGTIPADDKNFGGLSLKDRLAAHQRNATCAGCHSRIDPLGFPLERFDAVGRLRDKYTDGNPIHDSSTTYDKQQIAGVDGLSQYLKSQEKLVLKNFSKKLLGYALGRTMLLSDQPLIDQLSQAGSDATISKLVSQIVNSKQFRNRRETGETIQSKAPEAKPKEGGL
jgi:hypothetical protein